MKIKRILSMMLAVSMLLCLFTVSAFADTDVAIRYSDDDDEYIGYSSFQAAVNASVSGDEVYLVADDIMTESVTIPSGVRVVIASYNGYEDDNKGNNFSGNIQEGTAYATLTVQSGCTLAVSSGAELLVAGNQQSTQPRTGCLAGNYGAIELLGNLTVNGALYARGKIYGSGTVTTGSNAKVYQMLQIHDWRGGTKTLAAYNAGVFPFNCYKISNITAKAVYNYGTTLYGQYYVIANGSATSGNAVIIGSNGLLQLSGAGNITTEFNSAGRMAATINGSATTGDIGVNVRLYIFTYSFSSAGKVLPFGYNMDVVIPSGGALYVTNSIKLLPGCTFTNNGTLAVTGNLYVYGSNYSGTYNYAGWTSGTPAVVSGTVSGSGGVYSSVGSGTPSTTIKEYVQSSGATTVSFY